MTTVREALAQAIGRGLARPDAQMLLLYALDLSPLNRAWLLGHDTDTLTPAQVAQFEGAVERRLTLEPVAYITGRKQFYGLELHIDHRVLDPRDDTETLVDWTLELLDNQRKARVVDLGTGSGAIALALQHSRPTWDVLAVDFSGDALEVARANAKQLQLGVHFLQGSWLTPCQGRFDAIVSNPPYIADNDPHLSALLHEPPQALSSGTDGLNDIRNIIQQAIPKLNPGGWLLLEHGFDQGEAVRALLHAAGLLQVQTRRDLAGMERCSGGMATV